MTLSTISLRSQCVIYSTRPCFPSAVAGSAHQCTEDGPPVGEAVPPIAPVAVPTIEILSSGIHRCVVRCAQLEHNFKTL